MGGHGYRPDGMGYMGGGWWIGGLIGFLVFAALVAAVIVLLVKLNRARAGAGAARSGVAAGAVPGVAAGVAPAAGSVPRDALALLDERLARGDIDVADYEARRRALTGQPAPGASETRVDPLA